MYTVHATVSICIYIYIYVRNTELMENGSFRLFAANGNGKRKFDFHDRKTINGNR